MESINRSSDFNNIINGSNILVYFYADWSSMCTSMMEELDDIEDKINYKVYKINLDRNLSIGRKYHITSVPHIIIFDKGKVKSEVKGFLMESELLNTLTN